MKKIGVIIGDITNSAGTERAICNLSNILQSSPDYKIVILSANSSNGQCYFELNQDIAIEHLNMTPSTIINRIKGYLQFKKKINACVKKYNIDALIGTGHQFNTLLLFVNRNCKKIACEHMNYMSAPYYSRLLRKCAYPFLDAVICLTNKDAKKYTFISKDRLFVIPNSLSFTCDNPSFLTEKRIICVGRLTKQKGWDYLIAATPKIKESLPDWHIDIFGTGEDKDVLVKQMQDNNTSDYISFNEPTKNIRNEMLRSGIMCETSRWEGLPMVLVEAQACGIPIVGFDCPEGPADIIVDGKCGYLIPLGDIELLAKSIIEIAKDKELQIRMGQESYKLSKRFSPEVVADKWFKTLNKVFS